jgi:hypothetical protein
MTPYGRNEDPTVETDTHRESEEQVDPDRDLHEHAVPASVILNSE